MGLTIHPITYREAADWVKQNHRHNPPPCGCKWAIGVYSDETLCGVALCGRPVSRSLDNGHTIEIIRVCTDGTRNACSILYGACCRIAKEMGYTRAITYTLESEPGTSLRASGFQIDGYVRGRQWDCPSRRRKAAEELTNKIRWIRTLKCK